MGNDIDNGSTDKITLYCVLSSDHLTPATGKTVAVMISKNVASFGNPSGGATNASEIGHGWYYFTPSATDTGTNGPLIILGTNADIDDSTRDFMVVTAGGTAPTAAQVATAVWEDLLAGGDFGTSGSIGLLLATNIDTTISSRLATSGYTPPPTVAQIATKVWQDTTAGDFTTAGSIGKSLFTAGAVPGATGGLFIAGTNAATTVTTSFTTTFTGNLTGNVGGNVTGTIGGLTTAALALFFTTNTGDLFADAVSGSVVKETAIGSSSGGTDPWSTALPGSYTAGTAGYILGTNLNASITSRSTYAGTDTPGTLTLLGRIGSTITINGGAVAIDWANVANPASTVNLSGTTISAGQVVASVSGNVGGNVTGTIGGLTAGALAQFFTANSGKTYTDAIPGSVVYEIATNSSGGGSGLTAADVWTYGTRTLTALPSIPNNWLTAAGIAAGALNGKGDWSTYAGGDTSGTTTLLSRIGGAITIVSGGVNVNLAQTLGSARAVDSVADMSLTLNDAAHAAISGTSGQAAVDANALTYTRKTPFTGTVVRTFSIDSATAPKVRS